MPQVHSFSPLALDLPNTRMSVDFSTFTATHPIAPNSKPRRQAPPILPARSIPRKPIPRHIPLPNVQEELPAIDGAHLHRSRKWPWQQQPSHRESPVTILSRTNSSASTTSSNSSASTGASSIFDRNESRSTNRTSLLSMEHDGYPPKVPSKKRASLSSLPISLLESILALSLCLPLTVSIGPQCSENRHMQYRYHRAGLDYIDIQLIRKHPLFHVSHHIREVALDVLHEKCDFVIDFHRIYHTKVSSTVNDNLKAYERFWVAEQPPKMVVETLRSLSRLHLRLPVPSCENGGHRGRDESDWMDGSDGQGGGNWKIKSLKREQEDAARVLRCLDFVMTQVQTKPSTAELRGEPVKLSRSKSFTRSLSHAGSHDLRSEGQREPTNSTAEESKRCLKRLEVTLVKKNSHVTVLPDTLGLVKLLRSVPVHGFTKYHFELEEQQVLWATKHRKKWKGFEPDGKRLLNDLRNLTIADKPIEPIHTPTQFKFVKIDNTGQLQFSNTPIIVLERPGPNEEDPQPILQRSASKRRGLPWARKKGPARRNSNDSFAIMIEQGKKKVGSNGTTVSGRDVPPSVDELKKIAEDIKNGLY